MMWRAYVADLRQDAWYALRMLARAPGFTAAAVATLALGIGASAAMFSIVDGVLLRPLRFAEPDRLMMVRLSSGSRLSAGYLHDWRIGSRSIVDMAGWRDARLNLTSGGTPIEVLADQATPNFFAMLGVPPILGRTFVHGADLRRVEPEVVLSYGLWQRRFGGDPTVVGRAITLNDERLTIVGVMPQGFTIRTTELAESRAELWTPLPLNPAPDAWNGMGGFLHVVGRLAPGATPAQAQVELAAIAKRIEEEHPSYSHDWTVGVLPLLEATVMHVRLALLVLVGAVGILLLVACANVAHLVLSRALKRQPELAIRLSMGATAARLTRQFAAESLVLAVSGAAFGMVVAVWGTRAVLSAVPAGVDLPRIGEVGVDWRLLGFATVTTIVTAFLAGVAPLLGSLVSPRAQALTVTTRDSPSISRRRLQNSLIVSEVALAIVLLADAGLLIRSYGALISVDPGFGHGQVLTLRTTLPAAKYETDDHVRLFGTQLMERIDRLPGVDAVGTVNYLPLSRFGAAMRFDIGSRLSAGERDQKFSWVSVVGGRYFDAMGIPLRRGRLPAPSDHERAQPVFVIDDELARRFWPNQDPIGTRVTFDVGDNKTTTGEVIGVVGSVHWRGLAAEPEPTTYFWFPQAPLRELAIVARTVGAPADMAGPVAAQVAALDASQPVSEVRSMSELVTADLAQPRFVMLLLAGFAAVALLLAALGLYGAVSFGTAQRTREIGIRMALGAHRRDILRLVLHGGLRLAAIGTILGIAATFALGRLVTGLLYGVTVADPTTLLAVATLVGLIALLAVYIPARRATLLDPTAALAE
jgi:putative ABC transport system permease protein